MQHQDGERGVITLSQSAREAFVMPSLSGLCWTVCVLLLWKRTTAQTVGTGCSLTGPVGGQHPVQGLLERFEAGPGCAARESGNKETHVVAVGRVTDPDNKVTVLLKPLSLPPPPLRALHLLLSSRLPVSWWLEAERLPPDLPVLVQVSSNSSVQSRSLHLHVQAVHSLPFRPSALHRWALKHHGNLSSLTHTTHGNRVYVPLGEDTTLPAVCQLQSMFLSHNYMTSDLQQQEVQGCADTAAGGISPEVHVIKLHSAGSGLCGFLQVEVVVFLVPLVPNSAAQRIVLILSSSVPVNWAIVAHGVRGHISVYSSNSVSPPYPAEPDLTLSTTLDPDLSTIPDLLVWAGDSGYTKVTSYTEADLANRFVIKLAGGGTDKAAVINPVVVRPTWAEERQLRQWLMGGDGAGGGQESFTVQCEDGRLSVAVDKHILQSFSVPVAAVTLHDSTCQAVSNGSHFLLVFPVISCGTEGLPTGQPRGVQYKNMVLLWRDKPQTILALNETEKKSRSPLGIHFSCLALVPTLPGPADVDQVNVNTPWAGLVPWPPAAPGPDPGLSHLPVPRHRSGPVLTLKLFVTENYKQGRIGPCVVTADHRVYVEISARGPFIDAVEVKSCVVSPLSDPKKSPFWTVISDGCSSDPSLTLSAKTEDEDEEQIPGEGGLEEEKEQTEEQGKSRTDVSDGDISLRHIAEGTRERAPAGMTERRRSVRREEELQPLRFSFIMRPVFPDSMQFLHCSLRLCLPDPTRGKVVNGIVENHCQSGTRIPPMVSRSSRQQCEIRNLSRPMVVTQSISSLAPKLLRPPAGQGIKRLSVSPLSSPDPQHSSSMAHTGQVMGIIFAAFVMGASLMGGLWCIYYYTGAHSASLGGEGPLTDQTPAINNIWNPPSLSDQSSSCV